LFFKNAINEGMQL